MLTLLSQALLGIALLMVLGAFVELRTAWRFSRLRRGHVGDPGRVEIEGFTTAGEPLVARATTGIRTERDADAILELDRSDCNCRVFVDGELAIGPESRLSWTLAEFGAKVRLGRHREVNGDANWNDAMESYVGQVGEVTEHLGVDSQGCPVVHVSADSGNWAWRVRDLMKP